MTFGVIYFWRNKNEGILEVFTSYCVLSRQFAIKQLFNIAFYFMVLIFSCFLSPLNSVTIILIFIRIILSLIFFSLLVFFKYFYYFLFSICLHLCLVSRFIISSVITVIFIQLLSIYLIFF